MLLSKLSKPKRFFTSSSSSSSSSHNNPKKLSLPTLIKTGIIPTINHCNQFLLFLKRTQKFQVITHFFSQLNCNQIKVNSYTQSIFINALLKQHKYEEAEEFTSTLISRSNRIWDSLIQGLCINKQDPERALSVLRDCLRIDGIFPSSFTFCSLIHSFCNLGEMDRAIEVLELMSDERIRYPFDNFVCSKVISGFVKIGKPELAIGFYDNASALKPNIVTFTALLSAYCKLGRIEEANELVSTVENNGLECDIVFYSCWIYEYFSDGVLSKAFTKYREMMKNKIESDTISYTVLIDGFSKEGFVEKAVGFLKCMKNEKLEPNLVTYTAIMSGFCRKGKLEEGFKVLKVVEELGFELDEFMYATLIDGLCRKGDFDRVFDLLDKMEKKDIRPSVVTYNILINGLCKAKRTNEADDISKGITGDVITYATILHGYIKEENSFGMLETKRRFEESGVCMDVVMCNVLIKALFMVGFFEDALAIYKEMPRMGLVANSITYCTMIDGCFKSGRIGEALEISDDFRSTLISSVQCYNSVLFGLCKSGLVNLAIDVFIEVNERGLTLDRGIHIMMLKAIFEENDIAGILDFVCQIDNVGPEICNDAICFLCKKGFPEVSCDLYVHMTRNGLFVNIRSYHVILQGLISNFKRWPTQSILNKFVKNYGVLEPVTTILSQYLCIKDVDVALNFLKKTSVPLPVTVVERLTKKGRVLDAYKLVKGVNSNLCRMDVVDYTILIDGLCKRGYLDEALDLCDFATKKGTKLNIVTYNSILNGLCCQGCLVQAFRLFDSFEKFDVVASEVTYGTLIDALSNEGHMVDARKLFERMELQCLRPSTRIYNSLINGYCKLGQLQEGLNLLLGLEAKSLKPDEFTLSALINGFCGDGNIEEALKIFYEFKEKDLFPDFLGFLYLLRGLCSRGEMEQSRSLLKEMLSTEAVMNLLNRVEVESETESVQSFLVFLCEQGRIEEAISILNEVGSLFFPVRRCVEKVEELYENDLEFKSSNEETEEVKGTGDDYDESMQFTSFDSYYNIIASLCSRGEISKANKLAKMIQSF